MTEKIEREAALASLNDLFRNDIEPVGLDQVYPVETRLFKRWVRKSLLAKRQKTRLLRILKPLIDESAIRGVVFREATLVEDGSEVDVAILGVPEAFKSRLYDTDAFIIYADSGETDDEDPEDPEDPGDDNDDDGNMQEHCRYKKCYRVSPTDNKPWCKSFYQTNKDCPADECSSDEDCSGDEDGNGNVLDFFEVLSAF